MKRTLIAASSTAAASLRLEMARSGKHGTEVRSIEQVAARLAGGFLHPVETDALVEAATVTIGAASAAELGDLGAIADLPGLPVALAATLMKVWRADISLDDLASRHSTVPRVATLAGLEAKIVAHLPAAMLRPVDLVIRALGRINAVPAIIGPVEFRFLPDIAPCWRPLVTALAGKVELTWNAGPRPVPAWVSALNIRIITDSSAHPERSTFTCATAWHEVIEAMRWARGLLAAGTARPQDIAFAAAAPGEFDDLILATSQEANLDIHFGHGRRALTTPSGQAAAALADIVLHGLSQERVRRLATLAHEATTPFGRLPDGWTRMLPRAAPLGSPERWRQVLAASGADATVTEILQPAIDLLAQGTAKAAEAGEVFLTGAARLLWRRALGRAPATALEASLAGLRVPDTVEVGTAIGWMHAAALAASPRPYVWLLGLNARTWPRGATEDPLLPAHILPAATLEPLAVTEADRMAFAAIGVTTALQLVCSASRRDATGRLLSLSPLLQDGVAPSRLRRARLPEHAMSEQDRLMARPAEFALTARSHSAWTCWQDWNSPELTAHDGLVRPDHPVLGRTLARVHSASSLKLLLRNPLGFTWRYALGWREPDTSEETMDLDALALGNLVHGILDAALPGIAGAGGIGRVSSACIATAVAAARTRVATTWESEQPIPPSVLWNQRLQEAEHLACVALAWPLIPLTGQGSYGELPFGDSTATQLNSPWDIAQEVTVPGTALRIRGRIDRLDLAADRTAARVVDYKTGKPRDPGALAGGSELQRCLYAYAVRSLLGPDVAVEAALVYPRDQAGGYHPLSETEIVLETLTRALVRACESLRAGMALPGPDTGSLYDDLLFALPAAPGWQLDAKRENAKIQLGDAALIWEIA